MHPFTATLLTILAMTATALPLPLNINLGAYSPALVVGDGAISFEGAEGAEGAGEGAAGETRGVTELVSALQAQGAAAVTGAGPDVADVGNGNVAASATGTSILNDPTAALPTPGSAKLLDPRP